jgi:putative ABC transport system substrate-binding protein
MPMTIMRVTRREFIATLGSAAVWPLVARGQQGPIPVIGFLNARSPEGAEPFISAYNEGLRENGYVPGQNVAIEYRWARGQYDQLPALAADLVARQVALIAAFGGSPPIQAAKAVTTTVPIVFTTGLDPVTAGLVASLNRPGGNATGVYMFSGVLQAKQLGLLRELLPAGTLISVLVNPNAGSNGQAQLKELETAAKGAQQQIQFVKAQSRDELDSAFATIGQSPSKALLVMSDPFLNSERDKIISLAARYTLPAIYDLREFVLAGGLMSYGTSLTSAYRQVGAYSGQILKGANPANLPVLQSTRFDLVIILKTANALGLEVPPSLLARADEVIE